MGEVLDWLEKKELGYGEGLVLGYGEGYKRVGVWEMKDMEREKKRV